MGAQAVRLSNVDIDNALKNKDFEVLFQPIFDLGNGALARVETFVRWRHPALGVLPPGAFISFFESQGRMSELTRYVLVQALQQYSEWRGASAPGFSINLALSDLADEAFASHFAVLLRDRHFPPDLITLECPMPPVTVELPAAAEYFRRLSGTGARLAIEVRGRANDFLRQIDPFPFDEIKTGGAAILRFARTVRGPGLSAISELLEIANKANAAITAVGVEDQASLSALRGLGFAAAQGNHLGKVGPLSAFTPSRVNEVRELLGLEPLSPQDLFALFRTEAPAPQPSAEAAAAADTAPTGTHARSAAQDSDALVERLAARLARQAAQESAHAEPATVTSSEQATTPPRESGDRAAAAKAAAIARAKRKAAASALKEAAQPNARESAPVAAGELLAARSLQERLSREFTPNVETSTSTIGVQDGDGAEFDFPVETPISDDAGAGPQRQAAPMTDPVKKRSESKAAAPAEEKTDAVVGATLGGDAALDAAAAAASVDAAQAGIVLRTSLAVGKARAFFRPGLRVSAIRRVEDAARPAPGQAPARRAAADKSAPAHEATTTRTIAPSVAPATPPPNADQSADAAHATPEIEAHDETGPSDDMLAPPENVVVEEPQDIAGARARADRPKNFLTRKYRVWPTHFWPRSWKRAWRRREQEIARRRSERDGSDEAAAAE